MTNDEPHPASSSEDWEVVRTDDNGNIFAVRSGMTQKAARQLQDMLTRRGHMQLYEFMRSRPTAPRADAG